MGNRIVHFEIPATDSEKISKFYSDLFGWKFSKQDMPGMDYWMIETTGMGPEHLAGGMYKKQGNEGPRFYVDVEDIDAHTERLKQSGGNVVVEKQEIPGFGWSVLATDPEGNTLGLFQPMQRVEMPASPGRSSGRRSSGSRSRGRKKSSSKSSKKKGGRGRR